MKLKDNNRRAASIAKCISVIVFRATVRAMSMLIHIRFAALDRKVHFESLRSQLNRKSN